MHFSICILYYKKQGLAVCHITPSSIWSLSFRTGKALENTMVHESKRMKEAPLLLCNLRRCFFPSQFWTVSCCVLLTFDVFWPESKTKGSVCFFHRWSNQQLSQTAVTGTNEKEQPGRPTLNISMRGARAAAAARILFPPPHCSLSPPCSRHAPS